jgi:hypothetical protein
MFVVRLKRPNEDFDFKTFGAKRAAVARLRAAQREMIEGDVEQCALFEAQASDAETAIAMVDRGKARLLASDLSDAPLRTPARKPARKPARPNKRSTAKPSPNHRRSAR